MCRSAAHSHASPDRGSRGKTQPIHDEGNADDIWNQILEEESRGGGGGGGGGSYRYMRQEIKTSSIMMEILIRN